MRTATVFLALAVMTTACKKKSEPAPSETGSGSAVGSDVGPAPAGSDSGSGPAPAAAGSGEASMANKAAMCPSTVRGATTRAEVRGKFVAVIISADQDAATAEIQKRAQALLKERADKQTGSGHDKKGSHGGAMGICPVYVPDGATARYSVLDAKLGDGAMITISPKEKPEELKKEIDARIAKAADWVKANAKPGAGGGK